ncbi:unnamed protein product, partial [Strongylus vulgaris]
GAITVEPEPVVAIVETLPVTETAPAVEAEQPAAVTAAPVEPEASGDGEKKDEPSAEPAKPEEKPAAPAQKTPKEKQAELVGKFASWAKESLGLEEGKRAFTVAQVGLLLSGLARSVDVALMKFDMGTDITEWSAPFVRLSVR